MLSGSRASRAVVDTNLVVNGLISQRGAPHQLVLAWRIGAFQLLISDQLLAEFETVLTRPKLVEKYRLSSFASLTFHGLVQTAALRVQPIRTLPVNIRDPKDELVLAAALGGKADYLVTGDNDLLVLSEEPALRPLRIVRARLFLDLIGV
jgi:putative PIN family toxin of toxin-antitoxin system